MASKLVVIGDRFQSTRVRVTNQFGTTFDGRTVSATEAVDEAGLRYDVWAHPLPAVLDNGLVIPTHAAAILRGPTKTDPNTISLGVQSDKFRVISNLEIAETIDRAGLLPEWRVSAAGMSAEGSRMFIELENGTVQVANEDLKETLLVTEGKAGGGSLTLAYVNYRIRCTNALDTGLKSAALRLAVSHVGEVKRSLSVGVDIMSALKRTREDILSRFQKMALKRVTEDQVEAILKATWPVSYHGKAEIHRELGEDRFTALPGEHQQLLRSGILDEAADIARQEARRSAARERYWKIGEENPVIAGTAWAAYNAATEVADWREVGPKEIILTSVLFGERKAEKARAFDATWKIVARGA